MKKAILIMVSFIFYILNLSLSFAAYPTEIKTASRPGVVSQSGYDPIAGNWLDVYATTNDDTSNKRMFYSNSPESIPYIGYNIYYEGIVFNSAVRSEGGRVFLHHHNNSYTLTLKIAVMARNVGSSSGSITISRYGDGNGANFYNALEVGGKAVEQFFKSPPLNTTYSNIPVNGWVKLVEKTILPNQIVDINMDLIYKGAFRIYIAYVTSGSNYSDPLIFVKENYNLSSVYLPIVEGVARGDALYSRIINVNFNPDSLTNRRLRLNCCASGQVHPNDGVITAYDYTWNTTNPITRTINGNFGLLYKINFNTDSWYSNGSSNQLFVGLNPRGCPFLGGAYATADIPSLTGGFSIPYLSNNTQTGVLGRWGSYWRTVNIEYILPGGACGPNVFVITGFSP